MKLPNEWNKKEIDETEEERLHRPIEGEYTLYQAIKSGDLAYVKEDCARGGFADAEGLGVLSLNAITNLKYHFTIAAAMIARHCIEGGMDLEQAFRLSDFYIIKMDVCTQKKAICELYNAMCIDYTTKMQQLQKSNVISKSIQICLQYIYTHINETMSLEQLADHVNLSPSHLSRLFHQEMGISVSAYIREQKIEKAKNLLRYTCYPYCNQASL